MLLSPCARLGPYDLQARPGATTLLEQADRAIHELTSSHMSAEAGPAERAGG